VNAPVPMVTGTVSSSTRKLDGFVTLMKMLSAIVGAGLTVPEMVYAPETVDPAVGLVNVTVPAAKTPIGANAITRATVTARIVGSVFIVPPV